MQKKIPIQILKHYENIKPQIVKRLEEFSLVPESEYFYELAFCLCTPQSMAKNAIQVIEKLKAQDFLNNPFDPSDILGDKEHYIRFHITKANRLILALDSFHFVREVLKSDLNNFEKRNEISEIVEGFGLKESSHFLRNIGYRNLAILDRHILKHLTECGLYKEIPNVANRNIYFEVEKDFWLFSEKVGITIDELDLLFWSYETGEIIK
ncbi:MAG: hypothetical protein WCT77_10875 [Bacteroidota bacterium]